MFPRFAPVIFPRLAPVSLFPALSRTWHHHQLQVFVLRSPDWFFTLYACIAGWSNVDHMITSGPAELPLVTISIKLATVW